MKWNYRILAYHKGGFGLHEVYYDQNGKPNGMTIEPMIAGESQQDIISQLRLALRDAKERPILSELDISGNDLHQRGERKDKKLS